jgi:hypothetical protein
MHYFMTKGTNSMCIPELFICSTWFFRIFPPPCDRNDNPQKNLLLVELLLISIICFGWYETGFNSCSYDNLIIIKLLIWGIKGLLQKS